MKLKLKLSNSALIISVIAGLNVMIFVAAQAKPGWYWLFGFTMAMLIIAVYDTFQKRHAVIRNFPLIGHFRYIFESIRPEMRQYFFESDLDGRPFNRRQRSVVYQRAKSEKQTVAFGMQANPTIPGYEWVAHSLYPIHIEDENLRVLVGNFQCSQPYNASIYNVGAMSYGALSKTAIASLNAGARIGGFAHNTGEGGISEHHLKGGDLIWQIGTGYFGCRNEDGNFSESAYQINALRPSVKMIELKLSQGAKPGHGGILPAAKNTPEIAAIRHVVAGTTVSSPPRHSAFDDAEGMMHFLLRLRNLSEGKPVGFKICIGDKDEFIDLCRAMVNTGILPDFISIDGAEGGTGAAPLEFTDHLGMPMYDALAFAKQTLDEFRLTKHVRIIAAGKIITGFDILKALSLGASVCYSARGMMMALGCIQALICDTGRCPVGVATQEPSLYKGLHPADKMVRVASFHNKTVSATKEIMEACGFRNADAVKPSKFFRRLNEHESDSFENIYFNKKVLIPQNNNHPILN